MSTYNTHMLTLRVPNSDLVDTTVSNFTGTGEDSALRVSDTTLLIRTWKSAQTIAKEVGLSAHSTTESAPVAGLVFQLRAGYSSYYGYESKAVWEWLKRFH